MAAPKAEGGWPDPYRQDRNPHLVPHGSEEVSDRAAFVGSEFTQIYKKHTAPHTKTGNAAKWAHFTGHDPWGERPHGNPRGPNPAVMGACRPG